MDECGSREEREGLDWESFDDLTTLSEDELKRGLKEVVAEEQALSYRRRILHGKIDLLRTELVRRGGLALSPEELARTLMGAEGTGAEGEGGYRLKLCPECGAQVDEDARFCGSCGSPQLGGDSTVSYSPSFVEEEDLPISGGSEGAALIELDQVEGTAGRRMHDIGEKTVVGRGKECDIYLDDVTVSREHAEIQRGDHGLRVRDAGSLNGTYVNRVRVDAVDLRNGDEIQIGKYRFKFVLT